LSLFFIFPKPEMVSEYYRELTIKEGERLVPFSAEEFAAFRARHRGTSSLTSGNRCPRRINSLDTSGGSVLRTMTGPAMLE
jgi:hypothetical protein